jgi:TolA-binding protein
MKLACTCAMLAVALLATAGCSPKEITPLDRKQAANFSSEGDFAVTLRDFTRAENLYAQATKLCPDAGAYWVRLGSTRVRMGQKDAARTAYKQALKAFGDAADANKGNSDPALQQVYVLALLGRTDDARALLNKLSSRYPDSREVRAFVAGGQLDRLMADPQFKLIAL